MSVTHHPTPSASIQSPPTTNESVDHSSSRSHSHSHSQHHPPHTTGAAFSSSPSPPLLPAPSSSSPSPPFPLPFRCSFPISPGVGLGPFRLGEPIGVILQIIPRLFPAGRPREIEIIGSIQQPTQSDITVDVKELGVRLRFDAHTQRLTLIDIYQHQRMALTYMRSELGGSRRNHPNGDQPVNFAHLYHLFGPTYPGNYDVNDGVYFLQYPGLCMSFQLPHAPPHTVSENGVIDVGVDEMIVLADGSSPPLHRMFIHFGTDVNQHQPAMTPLPMTDTYFEPIQIHLNRGLYFDRRKVWILYDASTTQDLLTDLGAPENVYFKLPDDKMNIHRTPMPSHAHNATAAGGASNTNSPHLSATSPSITARQLAPSNPSGTNSTAAAVANTMPSHVSSSSSDYFYNYFRFGFDVLLDGCTHRVKKFVLHTNFIDRPDFGQYAKCNFVLTRANANASTTNASGETTSPSLLELPPTVASHSHRPPSGSLLNPVSSHGSLKSSPSTSDGTSTGAEPSVSSASTLSMANTPSPALTPSPPQSILLHTGVEDMDLAAAAATAASSGSGGGGGGGGKKKKKKSNASSTAPAAAAATAVTASGSALTPSTTPPLEPKDASRLPLPPRPLPSSATGGALTFSPSLSPSVLPISQATVIGPDSKWSDVLSTLGPCPSRPMVSSANGSSSSSSSSSMHGPHHPFPSTYFYAYSGAVFEVCKNHHLASVTLFRDE